MALTIWHNPRCSKSRQTLDLIEAAGIEPEIRRYLDDPPSPDELDAALRALDLEPWALARMGEPLAAELGLPDLPRDAANRERWIAILSANPRLIERPVVLADDGRAVLGRPPENVGGLL
ncbi:MAG TPA: arsenate reductase (glutaredoxin) [Solirubrobacterales bacterium]|jgi:arsenate reductase (glutaredoxin)|nr:arsenate reductase (glutaredoxin) [Solirubrobacterales bacterium]